MTPAKVKGSRSINAINQRAINVISARGAGKLRDPGGDLMAAWVYPPVGLLSYEAAPWVGVRN